MRLLSILFVFLFLFQVASAEMKTPQEVEFEERKAWRLANDRLEVFLLPGGGHIVSARLLNGMQAGINPFWVPQWKSIDPDSYRPEDHASLYGNDMEGPLLASIMGHNICLDFFGIPSEAEYEHGGITVHGEAPVITWTVVETGSDPEKVWLKYGADLEKSRLRVDRTVTLRQGEPVFRVEERVTNQGPFDRPIGWNQHVTLGAPFVEPGVTVFDIPAYRSMVAPFDFSPQMRYRKGAEFRWPHAPGADGRVAWRKAAKEAPSSDFTAHLLDPNREVAYFTAANPKLGLLVGYLWQTEDFPWLCNWEENRARTHTPWNGREITRGMEFSTTPMTYTRRQTIEKGPLFDTPTYRWLQAGQTATVSYAGFLTAIPEDFRGTYDLTVTNRGVNIERWSGSTLTLPFSP